MGDPLKEGWDGHDGHSEIPEEGPRGLEYPQEAQQEQRRLERGAPQKAASGRLAGTADKADRDTVPPKKQPQMAHGAAPRSGGLQDQAWGPQRLPRCHNHEGLCQETNYSEQQKAEPFL